MNNQKLPGGLADQKLYSTGKRMEGPAVPADRIGDKDVRQTE
jgi:hypothetical protein